MTGAGFALLFIFTAVSARSDEPKAESTSDAPAKKAFIDGTGPGWVPLTLKDFTPVNGAPDTWSEKDGIIHCTGKPVGVTRSAKEYKNFELVAEWKHLTSGGNSGIFVWTEKAALDEMPPDKAGLPQCGIEVQILDHGYTAKYEEGGKRKATWFTTNGDVFHVGRARMKPFEPVSPKGDRSFPRKNLSKGHGEWNHYYVRAINGEVRPGSTAKKCPVVTIVRPIRASSASSPKAPRSNSRISASANCLNSRASSSPLLGDPVCSL
jgi:hypothetical protein